MQQQQGGGGSQYGVPPPEMAPFTSPGAHMLAISDHDHNHNPPPEAASPISSRPPPPRQSFEELAPSAAGGFPDDDALAAGEEAERGGASGNRWPKQETLALLKIRSEMDATFRDTTLKGPLWDEVSRKLAELGYARSAKKCKEKFENVHKYYKRTKEGRAGRQDGKSYRFFTQLEALHGGIGIGMAGATPILAIPTTAYPALTAAPATPVGISSTMAAPARIHTIAPIPAPTFTTPTTTAVVPPASIPGMSLSSDTFSSSSFDSDDDEETEEGSKRKRGGSSSGGNRKMMSFFEGLMKQVMEKQEAMQQRFLETIEKREQDRMIREEAWKRQEMARLNHEHDLLAKERAVAASRDAAVISFLQKISGQMVQLPSAVSVPVATTPCHPTPPPRAPAPSPAVQQQPQVHAIPPQQQQMPPPSPQQQELLPPLQHHQDQQHKLEIVVLQQKLPPNPTLPAAASSTALVPALEAHDVVGVSGTLDPGLGVSPSRWPKSEVHALIKLRSGLESRYQEAGPKGPLWEEISSGMRQMGYNRSAKRCKEKWENINKYFKKVKESNKRRPEDAKTCPYFHQLDALYRKKAAIGGLLFANQRPLIQDAIRSDVIVTAEPPTGQPPVQAQETDKSNNSTGVNPMSAGGSGNIQIQTSNGGLPPSFFQEGTTMNKPEDIMKELMERRHQQSSLDEYDKLDEPDSDNLDDDDDDEDVEEEKKMQYKIQFQNVGGGGGNASAKAAAATSNGSFLAMVK